jgi:vacuolar-type H+-ATPase subunit C/Vma6
MSIQTEANKMKLVQDYTAMIADIQAISNLCNSLSNNKTACTSNTEYQELVSEQEAQKISEVENFLSAYPWG